MLGNKEIMAKNIKKYMERKGVSSSDVCAFLDIPKATFSYWLSAKSYPRIDKIELMAKYFGCNKADLVEDFDEIEWNPRTQEIYIEDNKEKMVIDLYRRSDAQTKELVERLLKMSEIYKLTKGN